MKASTFFIAMMSLAISTYAQASRGPNCRDKNELRALSSAAEEIQNTTVQDERIEIDRTKGEYTQLNGIGIIRSDSKTYDGTGFLVSPCHVLTNIHVAFLDKKAVAKGKKVFFSVGQTGSRSKPFSEANIPGQVIAHGEGYGKIGTQNFDWVVIKLSKSVGKDINPIPLYQMDSSKSAQRAVITAGYPADKTENQKIFSKMYGDIKCKVTATSEFGYLYHTCQTTGGQSGSPILAKAPNGKYYAIGMVSGGKSNDFDRFEDPDKANIAVSFESGKIYDVFAEGDKILSAIEANKCD